ncbi:tRNA-splicing endonuclease subunit Sen2 [Trichoplax sp. H2]|nr:tRNA-splicing endonuclease subunit Sen2 [Trichoplax sp. H2]|eukprot:RDD38571.1 tRNA-splicing endonuclease subunit Sen2 [Trichoplax sp. H2]
MELRRPVAKAKIAGKSQDTSPFPVPIASFTGKPCDISRWYYFEAKWNGDSISVRNQGDINMLYEMGFFGKGILSRGKPNFQFVTGSFQLSKKRKRLRKGIRRKLQVSFKPIRKERHKRHKQWREEYEWYASHRNSQELPNVPATASAPSSSASSNEDHSDSSGSSNNEGATINQIPQETDKVRSKQCKDPYLIYEYLQLTLEEAFFLVYAFNCLKIVDGNSSLEITELWRKCCQANPNFIPNYIAYHYYRSKGWVPKCGIKYGTHFLLYYKGPEFYHSSYSVVVECIDKTKCNNSRGMDWIALSTISRINERSAKDVVICYVTRPADLSDSELEHPSCIQKFTVKEVIVRRWLSEKARENVMKGNTMEISSGVESD